MVLNPRGFDAQRCATNGKCASPFMTVRGVRGGVQQWARSAQLDAKLAQHAFGFLGSELGDHLVPEG